MEGAARVLRKVCPYCRRDSYSATDHGTWICPYCGRDISTTVTGMYAGSELKRPAPGEAPETLETLSGACRQDQR